MARRVESLQSHAASELRSIRDMMQRATTFTALPGRGGVAMGVVGIGAAIVASRTTTPAEWLAVWLGAAAIAIPVGAVALVAKARALGIDLATGTARRFVLCLVPPILAGGALSAGLWSRGLYEVLPAAWLLLYGVATVVGGIFSPPLVPLMGTGFMVLGAVAAFAPLMVANVLLGLGFGGLHVVFGLLVARRYGG